MKTNLRTIPGIGETIEQNLIDLGYTSIASLKGADAEEIFARDCASRGCQLDRCLLYMYRLAVYYANHDTHEPEKLKWWNWKDID